MSLPLRMPAPDEALPQPQLSLVIPLYNEQRQMPGLQHALQEFAAAWTAHSHPQPYELRYELILVDDGSTDQTPLLLPQLAARFQADPLMTCTVLTHPSNAGKGAALKTGVRAASGKWILTLDADMATRPLQLLDWQQQGWIDLERDDKKIWIGSREHPDSQVSDTSSRRVIGRIFNCLIRLICQLPLRDTQCGFKLYPGTAARELFSQLVDVGWAHDIELLLRAQGLGYNIQSLPLTWTAGQESKIRVWRDAPRMFMALIAIRARCGCSRP